MKPKMVALVILAILAVIVAVQNAQVATLHLLFWRVSMSQIILTLISLLIGFVAGYIIAKLTATQKKT